MLRCIYNQKVTILNKQKRTNKPGSVDVWYKKVIENAAWYSEAVRQVINNGVVIGTVYKVLIPFNADYMRYKDWAKLQDKGSYFTMSSGDYIILGDVPDEVTASNIVEVTKKYEGDICTVKHITETHERFGATVQLKIEGV